MTVIGAYKAMGPEAVMQYIGGALILGGIVYYVLLENASNVTSAARFS